MNKEIWKDIPNYEGLYQASNLGRIKSLERIIKNKGSFSGKYHIKEKILQPRTDKDGYFRLSLSKEQKKKYYFVHQLVAKTFIENPNNYSIINHKDENKQNNCVENLEWCTNIYNINYGSAINRRKEKRSIKINQYSLNGELIKTWNSIKDAIKKYNGNTQICQCCKGNRKTACGYKWKYVAFD